MPIGLRGVDRGQKFFLEAARGKSRGKHALSDYILNREENRAELMLETTRIALSPSTYLSGKLFLRDKAFLSTTWRVRPSYICRNTPHVQRYVVTKPNAKAR